MADKVTKEPFPRSLAIANTVYTVGLSPAYGIKRYPKLTVASMAFTDAGASGGCEEAADDNE